MTPECSGCVACQEAAYSRPNRAVAYERWVRDGLSQGALAGLPSGLLKSSSSLRDRVAEFLPARSPATTSSSARRSALSDTDVRSLPLSLGEPLCANEQVREEQRTLARTPLRCTECEHVAVVLTGDGHSCMQCGETWGPEICPSCLRRASRQFLGGSCDQT